MINTFENGMVVDAIPELQPPGTYIKALNAVSASGEYLTSGLITEESNKLVATLGAEIVGKSYIKERHQTLYFTADDTIYLVNNDDNAVTNVVSASEFGCTWNFAKCEFLYGEFKYFNACNELHVYWSSDCTFHVVNIDEMLNPARKAAVLEENDCTYFDIFRCICGPRVSALPTLNSGGTLEGGAYNFAIQLTDYDGNETNVFDLSHTVIVETENNVPGEAGINSIRLHIDNLDKRYTTAIIYVTKRTGDGIQTFEKLESLSYGDQGLTYTYYGQKGELVDVSTITNKSKAYLRGQDIIQKDGRLFFYNLKNEKNLNYQKYANQIQVEWVEYEVSMEQQLRYHFPSLMRGEVYAIGIVWNYCDGTHSHVFHIPAGVAGSGGGGNNGGSGGSDDGATDTPTPQQAPAGDNYNPIQMSAFSTTDQFDRKRDPANKEDRPNEYDTLEEAISTDIDNIDTTETNMIAAAACDDCDCEGGTCGEGTQAMTNDLPDMSNTVQNQMELLADLLIDNKDPQVNQTGGLKAAIQRLLDAVKNREYITRKRPTLSYSDPNPGTGGVLSLGEVQPFGEEATAKSVRGDNWVDSLGNNLTEQVPKLIDSGATEVYESVREYGRAKDCDGNRFYPEGNVKHHRIPLRPHFVSHQNGVVNKFQPENYEYAHTYTRPIGLRLKGIHIPTEDELPKPLCPNNPFKVVYVERTDHNKSVFAKGWANQCFEGLANGKRHAFGRHGVNSKHTVDRFISAGADGTSRLGEEASRAIYLFHSPDTDLDKSYLPITHVRPELDLRGSGWLHELYAEGRAPEDSWAGFKVDQRGARISNNLNHYTIASGENIVAEGISYAPGDSVVTSGSGLAIPLMNRYRESSVYFQLASFLSGSAPDNSFPGGVLDHFGPTMCNAPYVALVRELEDQYGSVEGLRYAELGLKATLAHANGATTIEGICGDVWIGPYSKKRTSYVSNKQGDFFNVPAKPGSECRERSWCDSPADNIDQYLGLDFYPTKLPESGDKYDPKNYAGLHTINGDACGGAVSRDFADAAAQAGSESDWYWPRVLKGLVHCVVESSINPSLRQTGNADNGEVWYPKLKDMYLDSSMGHPWEESFLNRFYCKIEQPSKKQLAKKALIRSVLNLILPAGFVLTPLAIDGAFDMTAWPWVYSGVTGLWTVALFMFTNSKLNEMFGIKGCKRDEEGGDLDDSIVQWEDNYSRYALAYSSVNDIEAHYAFPLPYNTCDCDDCNKGDMHGRDRQLNNEIYYSNKQNLDSEIDAYKNVRINNYNEVPTHYGHIQRLFIQNNNLFIHTNAGYVLASLTEGLVAQDIASQQAGNGSLLNEPRLVFEGVAEGFAGTQHPNASINTPFGYFSIDEKAGKLYRFNGSPEEISAYGLFNHFKEKLQFCSPTECFDEKTSGDVHYSMGWDNRYNRLLLTKYDGDVCSSWTVSYTPIGVADEGGGARGKWLSFHSYIPQDYAWNREKLYSIRGAEIWEHNVKNSYLNFYGETKPFMVEFSATDGREFEFNYLTLNTIAEKYNPASKTLIRDLDITFNKMSVENTTQGTGTLPIVHASDDKGKRKSQREFIVSNPGKITLFKNGRYWNTNEPMDLVKSECKYEPLRFQECECEDIDNINESIFDCSILKTQNFENRRLWDNHLIYRYTFDNANDVRLIFLNHTTHTDNDAK